MLLAITIMDGPAINFARRIDFNFYQTTPSYTLQRRIPMYHGTVSSIDTASATGLSVCSCRLRSLSALTVLSSAIYISLSYSGLIQRGASNKVYNLTVMRLNPDRTTYVHVYMYVARNPENTQTQRGEKCKMPD